MTDKGTGKEANSSKDQLEQRKINTKMTSLNPNTSVMALKLNVCVLVAQ